MAGTALADPPAPKMKPKKIKSNNAGTRASHILSEMPKF